ncbi:MAG TPA: lytic transglycosylase domain-containing protein [Thermoanaerobaculia bacterium]|nr:lytic transglycosylase domain-containing protein [Thermoanaerobaculia bacterium]
MKVVPATVWSLICVTCAAASLAAASLPAPAAAAAADVASPSSRPPRLHPFQHAEQAARPQPVRIAVGADGRRVILSETPIQHARRFAAELLPVPDLPGLPSGALEPMIRRHCDARHLDPRLVQAVIQVESGYNHRARSNKGAMGLMQLMPDTAVELAVFHPFDVDDNLRGGTTYLRQMIDAFRGSIEMALAAYNAGPGAVERHHGVPPFPDTVDYVKRVMALYQGDANPLQLGQARQPRQTLAWQWHQGRRPAPFVTRGANGRLLVTTSLAQLH